MLKRERIALLVTAVLIAATGILSVPRPAAPERVKPGHIRGVLEISPLTDTARTLLAGFHYHMLQRFAAWNGQSVEILLAGPDRSYLDSLRAGAVDLVIVPLTDSLAADSVLVSRPVEGLSYWLMRANDTEGMEELNTWIGIWQDSEEARQVRQSFLQHSVSRRARSGAISPYDSLIRTQADSIGWDWHMLAAVIFQESRFHIEVRSRRGASGLMQLMPRTAERYGVTDPLDPEMNIAAGARLLSNLYQRYARLTDDEEERYKFTLAAYNAGVGRIDDCLNLARTLGVDPTRWENIVTQVLPRMTGEEEFPADVVKLGPFKGRENVAYVETTMEVYRRFCRICP